MDLGCYLETANGSLNQSQASCCRSWTAPVSHKQAQTISNIQVKPRHMCTILARTAMRIELPVQPSQLSRCATKKRTPLIMCVLCSHAASVLDQAEVAFCRGTPYTTLMCREI